MFTVDDDGTLLTCVPAAFTSGSVFPFHTVAWVFVWIAELTDAGFVKRLFGITFRELEWPETDENRALWERVTDLPGVILRQRDSREMEVERSYSIPWSAGCPSPSCTCG
jgi:hypothetical protein